MRLLGVSTDLHAHGGRPTQAEVEQHEVGQLLLHQFPVGHLAVGRSQDVSLGNIVTDDALGAFEFECHVFDNDNIKISHISLL